VHSKEWRRWERRIHYRLEVIMEEIWTKVFYYKVIMEKIWSKVFYYKIIWRMEVIMDKIIDMDQSILL
jgi:hypothetical protein